MTRVEELKARACAEVDRQRQALVDLSLKMHAGGTGGGAPDRKGLGNRPGSPIQEVELAFQEVKASGWLCDFLEGNGFAVQRGVGSLPTAFRGEVRAGDGPTVAFLSEYDGLPIYGQSCGHNVGAAAGVGAAVGLKAVIEDLGGTVLSLGTPGEEGGGGKIIMAREGAFAGIDAMLLIYPGMYNIADSRTLAVTGVHVEYFGKAAHAAANPELGINALDALIQAFNGVNALRQQLRSDVRIHGIIREGGVLPMVIPDHTSADIRVRANDDAMLDHVIPRITACIEAAAQMTGARVEYRWNERRGKALLSNGPLAAAFAGNLQRLGRDVRPRDELTGAWSGDTGVASHVVPTIQPQIAMTGPDVPPHSHEFHEASASPAAAECIVDAAKAMAITGIDLLADPALLAAVKQDFTRGLALRGEV